MEMKRPTNPTTTTAFARAMWIVTVAGVASGLVIVGVGSRLAMLLLRVTSNQSVRGMRSDDGFVIGQFTFGDTYGLVQIGALVGPIAATIYLLIRPWLLGPHWFRYTTVGLAAGAVGGSMLLHADGVDFRYLGPRWLAIGLFVAIPAVFGTTTAITVDALEQVAHPNRVSHVTALLCGPAALLSYLLVVPITIVLTATRTTPPRAPHPATTVIVRVVWLGIAVIGLNALLTDIRSIVDLPPPPR
jgi:hypothetical protein